MDLRAQDDRRELIPGLILTHFQGGGFAAPLFYCLHSSNRNRPFSCPSHPLTKASRGLHSYGRRRGHEGIPQKRVAPDSRLGYNDEAMKQATSEIAVLVERLQPLSLPDGGLPFYRGNASAAEPTFLAALASSASGAPAELTKPLLAWARQLQNPNGSIGVDSGHRNQGVWLTALSAIVFHHFGLEENAKRALDFILSLRSVTGPKDPRLRQDDTLPGWPWVPGTSGWVEPTAWSLIALSLSGLIGHPRAEEGVRFLLDRQIPSGGWNYGNPALDGKELLPFWDTTGLTLVALHGHVDPKQVGRSLELMEKNQGKIESLSGLSWAVLSLDSDRRDAGRARGRLLKVMGSLHDEEFHAGNFALGLIALAGKKVFSS